MKTLFLSSLFCSWTAFPRAFTEHQLRTLEALLQTLAPDSTFPSLASLALALPIDQNSAHPFQPQDFSRYSAPMGTIICSTTLQAIIFGILSPSHLQSITFSFEKHFQHSSHSRQIQPCALHSPRLHTIIQPLNPYKTQKNINQSFSLSKL